MPIYEYFCPDNNTVYQFFAKTLAQGERVPRCPDNPKFRMRKMVSRIAVVGGDKTRAGAEPGGTASDAGPTEDARMEAAMGAMEKEFSNVDESDPRAMGRMMRRMAELSGEKIDGEMEEVVRKLEEGADPESLEDQLGEGAAGGLEDPLGAGPGGGQAGEAAERAPRHRFKVRRQPVRRDPQLYDYE